MVSLTNISRNRTAHPMKPMLQPTTTLLVGLAIAAATMPLHTSADPVQGAVLGGAVGAVIGGGAGAAAGAVLGGAGGARSQEQKRADQARWKEYYENQQAKPTEAPPIAAVDTAEPEPPIPSGSGLIKEIQRNLLQLGYDPGPADGLTDGPTMDAIRTYQEDHALMTTGKPSRELLQHLRRQLETI